jgi:hypothetical protein
MDDHDRQRLHENDFTPRPAAVAFERMTSLLNDATLIRWVDLPGGSHLLYYEKDDGGAVAAVWRPFGLSPTLLSFAGLPSTFQVLDCFGMTEPVVTDRSLRLIEVNEVVRYIVAPAGQAGLLNEAIGTVQARITSPESQPAR